jgi:hypothetical protein
MQGFSCTGVFDMRKLHQLQHPSCGRTPGINSSFDRDEIRCFAIAIAIAI